MFTDIESLKDYLLSFDVFKGNEQEGVNYLNDSFNRHLITLSLIPTEGKLNILELGANPYFQTLLLKKFTPHDLFLANYFSEARQCHDGSQQVNSKKYSESHLFHFKHFNVEQEDFPYTDCSFEVVIFAEILEHLTVDPVWTLKEINRVLKPNGKLIVTTPNVCRLENIQRLQRGENLYDPYSGYGVYGRHNREYTLTELNQLVTNASFGNIYSFTADLHPQGKVRQDAYGENLFLRCDKLAAAKLFYPAWLFRSMHGYRRINQQEDIGEKQVVSKIKGVYDLENFPPLMRWTTERFSISIQEVKWSKLVLRVLTSFSAGGDCRLQINYDGQLMTEYVFPQETKQEISLENLSGVEQITVDVLSSWRPVDYSEMNNLDSRRLGIILEQIEVVDP